MILKKKDYKTQCKAGWYDWFCNTEELGERLIKFGDILIMIDNDFLLDNFSIWFKNNCPCDYPLYDDMRLEPLDEDKRAQLFFGIKVDCGYEMQKYTIFTARNGYRTEKEADDQIKIIAFMNNWKE